MPNNFTSPNGYVGFGKLSNCTLSLCDIKYSVFEYRPSLAANSIFLALFMLAGLWHLIQGFHSWKSRRYSTQWFYCWAMVLGCITEIVGYIGRILLHSNPFEFDYFLVQIGMLMFLRDSLQSLSGRNSADFITSKSVLRSLPLFSARLYTLHWVNGL
jgi:hypothetical protein